MCEWGAMRDERAAEDVLGGSGALCAGVVEGPAVLIAVNVEEEIRTRHWTRGAKFPIIT